MIVYKATSWKKRKGEYRATVEQVDAVPNQAYNPDKPNSSPYSLTLFFKCLDPESGELFEQRQMFVNPLIGGGTLFDQLLEAKGIIPDMDGGEIEEQDFVGMDVIITIGERPDKNDVSKVYPNVEKIVAAPSKTPKKVAAKKETPKTVKSDGDEGLPF